MIHVSIDLFLKDDSFAHRVAALGGSHLQSYKLNAKNAVDV
ncbi:hypothetical protein HMPREF9136_0256 [Prevotella dentalis DSM 3688]|uniref:Uncharacterized protein n=1 Tax=Prevotella dentalis (strain ATCC 49559 / DSM 3688 / JCM 13448 / NCTC 12043 / ES 2772) TaxID=908937 RepID=F9D079_PREDD|nr:hypothetical protein HMPREF9136_0256 [Prevotella dentalis DSM 3688]